MGGNHAHGQHAHSHAPAASLNERRLIVVVAIAWSLVAFQLVGALLTSSLALLFDTVHVFTDAVGVSVALAAVRLTRLPASSHHTWGFRRVEVLAAMFQAVILLGVGIVVLYEAIQRLANPAPIPGREILIFGVIGMLGNVIMIVVLMGGDRTNFNMRAAFLEVLNDALGSLAVIISALVIWQTGFYQADAIVAMLIGLLIIPRTIRLFHETAAVLLEATPRGLDLDDVRRHLEASLTCSRSTTSMPAKSPPTCLSSQRTSSSKTSASHPGIRRRSSRTCKRAWPSTSTSRSSTPRSSLSRSGSRLTSSCGVCRKGLAQEAGVGAGVNLTTPSCGLDVPCAFRLRVFRHEKRKLLTFIGLKVISRYFGRRLSRRGGKKGTFTTKWWESNPALPGRANQKGGHYRITRPTCLPRYRSI
ncbi:cation diffusion facilitator family transporter [Trueperella pyogenes]